MPERKWDKEKERERKAEYRRRKKAEERGETEEPNEPLQPESQEAPEAPEEPPRPKTTGQYPKRREAPPEGSTEVVQTEVLKLLQVRPLDVLLALDPYEPISAGEEQVLRDHFGYSVKEKRTRAERQAAADAITSEASWATEQEYVDFQLEVTKAQFERLPPAPDSKITMADRLARTEKYARWRWQAFLAGEVVSL